MKAESKRVGGIVLCGGESRRMGRPKAWLPAGGEFLLQRMVRTVSQVASPVVVATRPGMSLPPLPAGVGVALDPEGAVGPLAGIAAGLAALQESGCGVAVVTACDHAYLSPAFLGRMIELLTEEFDAVVGTTDGTLTPTLAIYRLTCLPLLRGLLDRGERRATELVRRCNARVAGPDQFRDVDPQFLSLRNLNEPEDYDEFLNSLPR